MADEYETLHEAYEAWERLKESIVCFGDQIVASMIIDIRGTIMAMAAIVLDVALIASEHLMAPLMPSAIIDPRHGNMIPVLIDTQTHIPCRVVFTDGPTITIMPESIFDSIIYN